MAQAATNPKIEELRSRLKADPKSRLFFPLAEELRKVAQLTEAEQVLRTGLTSHPTYLSAWVSLGRVLHDLHNDVDAVSALNKALQLDPGNVVAARLLAEAYMALGEKVEAIKKYKLVYALLPGDQELEGIITRLDREINAPAIIPEPEAEPAADESPFESAPDSGPAVAEEPQPAPVPSHEPPPFEPPTFDATPFDMPSSAMPAADGGIWDDTDEARIFHDSTLTMRREQATEVETGDAEPMSAAHSESPFEEPAVEEGYGADAFAIEQPGGMHIATAPMAADLPEPLPLEPVESAAQDVPPPAESAADEADVFEPADGGLAPGIVTEPFAATSTLPPVDADDFARTLTMADLYANQGLVDEARDIYEDILARDPNNAVVRARMEALSGAGPALGESEPPEGPWAEDPEEPPAPPTLEAPSMLSPMPEPLPDVQPAAHVPAAEEAHPSSANAKVEKLSGWLTKVKRGEQGV